MLVLSRKNRQRLVIDQRITVTVIEIRGNTVRLGIEAPSEVPVHREEVFEKIVSRPSPAAISNRCA